MSLQACLKPEAILEWLDDSLPPEIESQFTEHLEFCSDCRNKVERLAVNDQPLGDFERQLQRLPRSSLTVDAQADYWNTSGYVDKALQLLGPTDDPAMLGRLGRFEVSGVIGSGATSFVYKALDTSLNRTVALKLLTPALSNLAASRKRFQREGRAIASVRDPHVVDVDGVESHQDLPFIVMQYVAGGSLQSRLDREGYMATEEVTRIGLQIAKGLAAAHAQGITHRDIKPSNVLVDCGSDRAIVSDFGLAHVTGDASMTHTGMIAGTPQYMSPEQAEGIRVDVRSDLFSLGCVLYTCCTGVAPFRSESILGILKAVTEAEPTPMRQINPHIAPWLEAFVAKLMAKQMDDRFQTADEVANHLSEELACLQSSEQKPIPERLWWPKSVNLANRSRSRIKTAIVLASLLTAAAFAFAVWDSSYNSGRTANALGIYDAGLRNSGTNQLSGSDYPFATRITPTLAESNYAAAKAAYDLSYETHVQEANLSGDMYESIQRHKRALRLEFDPARSAFHLARAFAIEGREKEMLESFDAALNSGFCDGQSLRSTRDLKLFRGSTVLEKVAKRVAKSEKQLEHLKTVYFVEANYAEAALLGRQRLQTYPNDEFTQLLVAGGLTELAFVDRSLIAEARIWNERIRDSVRYANFGSYNLGCIALMEGKIQTSLDYLHYAVSTGFTDIDHLVSDPMLSDLKHDPRFITLAKTVQNRN